MEFSMVTEFDRRYLVCDYHEMTEGSNYVLEMLMHNQIQGILPAEWRRIDGRQQIYMDAEQKISLSDQLLGGSMASREELYGLLKEILQAAERLHDYLLSGDCLILQPESIFWSTVEKQWYFACCPGQKKELMQQIVLLMEYFMQRMNYKNQEMVSLVYDCYGMGKQSERGVSDYRAFIEKLDAQYRQEEMERAKKEERRKEALREGADGILPLTPEMEQSFPFETVREENHSEREVRYHSKKTWGMCLAGTMLSVIVLAGAYAGGLFENEVTGFFEPARLAAALGIAAVINIVWYRRRLAKKEYKIITEVMYENPRENLEPVGEEERKADEGAEVKAGKEEKKVEGESGKETFERTAYGKTELPQQGDIGETVLLASHEADNPTVLLAAKKEAESCYYLKACSPEYEDICLVEYPFFIGKLKKNVNFTIDCEVISRYHVKLEQGKHDGEVIVTDLNSTNGTYLNGQKLPQQEQGVLKVGDRLTLADVSYQFMKL